MVTSGVEAIVTQGTAKRATVDATNTGVDRETTLTPANISTAKNLMMMNTFGIYSAKCKTVMRKAICVAV